MISALPDIKKTTITEQDEFMILACDGIWNSMTSDEVVSFVSKRLQSGQTKLSTICEEVIVILALNHVFNRSYRHKYNLLTNRRLFFFFFL